MATLNDHEIDSKLNEIIEEMMRKGTLPRQAKDKMEEMKDLVKVSLKAMFPQGVDERVFNTAQGLFAIKSLISSISMLPPQQLFALSRGLVNDLEKQQLAKVLRNFLNILNKALPPELQVDDREVQNQAEELAEKFIDKVPQEAARRALGQIAVTITRALTAPKPVPYAVTAGQVEKFIEEGLSSESVLSKQTIYDPSQGDAQSYQDNILVGLLALGALSPGLKQAMEDENLLPHHSSIPGMKPNWA